MNTDSETRGGLDTVRAWGVLAAPLFLVSGAFHVLLGLTHAVDTRQTYI